jgi:hypothetical protein
MDDDVPTYKFQELRASQLGLEFVDSVYRLTRRLPKSELVIMRSQLEEHFRLSC